MQKQFYIFFIVERSFRLQFLGDFYGNNFSRQFFSSIFRKLDKSENLIQKSQPEDHQTVEPPDLVGTIHTTQDMGVIPREQHADPLPPQKRQN